MVSGKTMTGPNHSLNATYEYPTNSNYNNGYSSPGRGYSLVSIHNMQPISQVTLFDALVQFSSASDSVPSYSISVPPAFPGPFNILTNGSTHYGQPQVVSNVLDGIAKAVIAQMGSMPVSQNPDKIIDYYRGIVKHVKRTFEDKLVYITNVTPNMITHVDAQSFHAAFQQLIDQTLVHIFFTSFVAYDSNYDWLSIAKNPRLKMTKRSTVATTQKPDELAAGLDQVGIDYQRFGEKVFVIDGETDVANLVMVAIPDVSVQFAYDFDVYVREFKQMGLL